MEELISVLYKPITSEDIDELYKIAKSEDIEEFKKNIFRFSALFHQINSFWEMNDKIYTIILFLLDKGKFFADFCDDEYFLDKVITYVDEYQKQKIFNMLSKYKKSNYEQLKIAFYEYERHNEILNRLNDPIILEDVNANLCNSFAFSNFTNNDFDIYICDLLSLILSNYFLHIPVVETRNVVKKILLILNKFSNLDKGSIFINDLLIKYMDRILPIRIFLTDEDIIHDSIIYNIIAGKYNSIKLLRKTVESLSVKMIIRLFGDFENVFDTITRIENCDYYTKLDLLIILINKCLNEDDFEYLIFLFNSKYDNNNFADEIKYKFGFEIKKIIEEYGVYDKESLKILDRLDMRYCPNVIDNLNEINDRNIVIDYDEAFELLDKYFSNQILLDKKQMKIIIRAIAKHYLEQNNIYGFKILFIKSKTSLGIEDFEDKKIYINEILVEGLLNKELELPKRLKLFETLFHEIQHSIQVNDIHNNKFDLQTYLMLKESILQQFDINYYKKNYASFLMEIDARKCGFENSRIFLFQFEALRDQLDFVFEDDYSFSDYFNKKQFDVAVNPEYIDVLFDRLVLFHPQIIKENPILKCEYDENGVKHAIDLEKLPCELEIRSKNL